MKIELIFLALLHFNVKIYVSCLVWLIFWCCFFFLLELTSIGWSSSSVSDSTCSTISFWVSSWVTPFFNRLSPHIQFSCFCCFEALLYWNIGLIKTFRRVKHWFINPRKSFIIWEANQFIIDWVTVSLKSLSVNSAPQK